MHPRITRSEEKGFTLIELLIVIAIIGFLAAAVLVAVDPVKRIQDSRDARRFSEANAILNAILTKQVDDRRVFNGLTAETGATNYLTPDPDLVPALRSAGAFSQVIITGDTDALIDCEDAVTPYDFPSCPGAPHPLNATGTRTCVAALGGLMTGTAVSVAADVAGTNTLFDTEAVIGDTLLSASGGTCIIEEITDFETIVCTATPSPAFAGTVINTTRSIVDEYIAEIPSDPIGAGSLPAGQEEYLPIGDLNSGYYIWRNSGNRIEIGSCNPEQESSISVRR